MMQNRRQFTKRIVTAIAGASFWGVSAHTPPHVRGAEPSPSPGVHTPLTSVVQPDTDDIAAYPTVTYVPAGYRPFGYYTARPDGFNGGTNEIAAFYKDPTNPIAYNRPLCVFMTRTPQRDYLAALGQHSGTSVDLHLQEGESISAKYHDGLWAISAESAELYWDDSDVHSLTFSLHGFKIGIRGSRLARVTEAELANIAHSITM